MLPGWLTYMQSEGAIAAWPLDDAWTWLASLQAGNNRAATRPVAQAGVINSESYMERTATWAAPGWAWIAAYTQGEYTHDGLKFYLDGVQQTFFADAMGGPRVLWCAVPAGTHTIRVSYVKDVSVNIGFDTGWVRQVLFGVNAGYRSDCVFESHDFANAALGALPAGWVAGGSNGGWTIQTVPNPTGTAWNDLGYSKEHISGRLDPYSGKSGNQAGNWWRHDGVAPPTFGGSFPASVDFPSALSANYQAHLSPPPYVGNFEWSDRFSFECWFNNNSFNTVNTLCMKEGPGSGCGWGVQFHSASEMDFFLYNNWGVNRAVRSFPYAVNTWYHLVCTNDGSGTSSGMRCYLNGLEVTYDSFTTDLGSIPTAGSIRNAAPFAIGGRPSDNYPMDGQVAGFVLYDKVLSFDDALRHFVLSPWFDVSTIAGSLAVAGSSLHRAPSRALTRVAGSSLHTSTKRPSIQVKNDTLAHLTAKQKSIVIRPNKGLSKGRGGRLSKLNPGED